MIVSLPTLDGRDLGQGLSFTLDNKWVHMGRFRKLSKGLASVVESERGELRFAARDPHRATTLAGSWQSLAGILLLGS
jgi:hypothetical protein